MQALDRLFSAYLGLREQPSEVFCDTVKRIGVDPFRNALYEVPCAA
jgi:hypothetical protein